MNAAVFCRRLACAILVALLSCQAAGQEARPTEAAAQASGTAATKDRDAAPDAAVNQGGPEAAQKALCTLIETAAVDNGLPIGFFTRLIWKESRFRHDAVSPKGAQGIAQFMPGTAKERGLEDPFDPPTAITASASLLADLARRFGNLGLAAAAYNAGADRVSDWIANNATLPFETQDYVLSVTGVPAANWADPDSKPALPAEPKGAKDCLALARLLKNTGAPLAPDIETAHAPWGVQVAGEFSRALAIGVYSNLQRRYPALLAGRAPMIVGGRMPGRGTRAFYRVRVPVETRAEGEKFCAKFRAAGGDCVVLKT